MIQSHWLISSVIRRVAQQARGPALPLAKEMLRQIPQLISSGMSVELALRESLLLAIYSAQIKARQCVGSERHALEDFIATCSQIENLTEHLYSV